MADKRPIRWDLARGTERFRGQAMYIRDQQESLRLAFAQPSRFYQVRIPPGITIKMVLGPVVDYIQIAMGGGRRPGPMVWDIEPPYLLGEDGKLDKDPASGKPTWVLDFDSEDMEKDPDVEGGFYFLASVRNGFNNQGLLLRAIFNLKKGKDEHEVEYHGWSFKQGLRVIVEEESIYKIDGKTVTVLLGKDVEGDAVIVANDGETILTRKIAIPNEWQIVYQIDLINLPREVQITMTDFYLIASKKTLEPIPKYFTTSPARYWPEMAETTYFKQESENSSTFDSLNSSNGENEYTIGGSSTWQSSGSIQLISNVWTEDHIVYWTSPGYSTSESGRSTLTYRRASVGYPFIIINKSSQSSRSSTQWDVFNIGSDHHSFTWVENASHNGSLITFESSSYTTSDDVTTSFVVVNTTYLRYDEELYPLAELTTTMGDSTGTTLSPIKLKCYRKEDLVNRNGDPQPADVAILSYYLYEYGNPEPSFGYTAIINGQAITKIFPSISYGGHLYHELIEMGDNQFWGNGFFDVYIRKGGS